MDSPLAPSELAGEARRLLALARRDKRAASTALAAFSSEQQVALACATPAGQRARLLDLLPDPAVVVPLLPDAELVFTVKAAGLDDSSWLLEHATSRQISACFDLDAWDGLVPDRSQLSQWFDVIAEAGEETLLRAAQAIDPETLTLYLSSRVHVMLDPKDEEWQPPPGAQTLEGQFYFVARADADDIDALMKLLHALFRNDYWLYFRMMQAVMWELESELEEWALRWRTGRIEDLGFPPWEEAMRIYGFLRPEQRAVLAERTWMGDANEWDLPVWIPDLPALSGRDHVLFRAAFELDDSERRAFFYSFVALANKVAVADRMSLGDTDTLPGAIEKAAEVASRGLTHVANETGVGLPEVIARSTLEYLFRVGASLDPESARPAWLAKAQQGDEDEAAEERTGPASER